MARGTPTIRIGGKAGSRTLSKRQRNLLHARQMAAHPRQRKLPPGEKMVFGRIVHVKGEG